MAMGNYKGVGAGRLARIALRQCCFQPEGGALPADFPGLQAGEGADN